MRNKKRRFTDQDFDIMIEQLVVQKPASFDMLCEISDKTLHGWVIKECQANPVLHNRGLEEDIFIDIQIRLIQKTVTDFLMKNGNPGVINRDPDGFKSWMFTVAGNLIKDTAKKIGRDDSRYRGFFDDEENQIEDDVLVDNDWQGLPLTHDHSEMLSLAVSIVLDSRSQPYIVLTWLAMCVFVLSADMTKIASNHKILDVFFDKSLNEMYGMLKAASKKIPWLVISQEQEKKMMEKLSKPAPGGKTYGETPYKEFFMIKEPLSTISDWENRMNGLVKRVMKNEASNK